MAKASQASTPHHLSLLLYALLTLPGFLPNRLAGPVLLLLADWSPSTAAQQMQHPAALQLLPAAGHQGQGVQAAA